MININGIKKMCRRKSTKKTQKTMTDDKKTRYFTYIKRNRSRVADCGLRL